MAKNKTAPKKVETQKEIKNEITKEEIKQDKKRMSIAKLFLNLAQFIIVFGVLVAAAFFWSQPETISRQINNFIKEYNPDAVSEKGQKIQNSLDNLTAQINHLTEQNSYFLNVKADSSVVLGMVERLDLIEKRVQKLSLMSNDGALILTAAMMVKDAASMGYSFEYEAEVLKLLSENQPEIETEIDSIVTLSSKTFDSDLVIIDRFNTAYQKILEQTKPANDAHWKDKIVHKAQEYVKITFKDEAVKEAPYDKIAALKKIKVLVDNQDFTKAIEELTSPQNKELYDDNNIKIWVDDAKNKLKFYQDLAKISAYSLTIMKTDILQNKSY